MTKTSDSKAAYRIFKRTKLDEKVCEHTEPARGKAVLTYTRKTPYSTVLDSLNRKEK